MVRLIFAGPLLQFAHASNCHQLAIRMPRFLADYLSSQVSLPNKYLLIFNAANALLIFRGPL